MSRVDDSREFSGRHALRRRDRLDDFSPQISPTPEGVLVTPFYLTFGKTDPAWLIATEGGAAPAGPDRDFKHPAC